MYFLKSANYQLHTSQGVLMENQPVQSAVRPMLTENSPRPNGAAQICMASWGFPPSSLSPVSRKMLPIHHQALTPWAWEGTNSVVAGKLRVEYRVSCQHPVASSATAAYGFCQHSHALTALIAGTYFSFISVWVDLIAPWAIGRSLAYDRLHRASQELVRNIIWITVHFQDETLVMFLI